SNTGPSVPTVDEMSMDPADGSSPPWSFSLQERAEQSLIQSAINMCQNAQCNYLGGGEGKSAWKVDLSESHRAIYVLKVFTDRFLPYKIAVELHNLNKVKQLVEWGEIVTVKNEHGRKVRAVYYILMHYMGMSKKELGQEYKGLDLNYDELQHKAWSRYATDYKMENDDVKDEHFVYHVEEKNGHKRVTAELIDWESATDSTIEWGRGKGDSSRLPPLFPENVRAPKREVEDSMLGNFVAKKTS
ncbi:hypothetical protein H0H93_012198, partial [Arthromyces matolae]